MMERAGAVTFQGSPLTLMGTELKAGDAAPDFTATSGDMKPVKLSDFKGGVIVLSSVPSLDTPVCAIQTRKFNEEAGRLKAKIITISMDLPFAQTRFCDTYKTGNIVIVSDYKDREFGRRYGLLIKELGLLARAVTVVSAAGKVVYQEIVREITREPDYQTAIQRIKEAAGAAG